MPRAPKPARNPRAKHGADAARMPEVISELRATALDTSRPGAAALTNPDKPLTEKQKLFVKYWAQGETILSASVKAGYTDGGTYAYRLARMPAVLAIYEREKKAYEAACGMSRKRVMEGLLEAVEMAKLLAEPTAMVAGWREIGKMCGYYEPVQKKVDITVNGTVVMERMNRLSDAELLKLIQGEITGAADGDEEDESPGDDPLQLEG